jgi:[protein-PII] uridylyltransferase
VQHEFFHRYTADEHTLQTIEMLDKLSDEKHRRFAQLVGLFHDLEDPEILYLALLMHDTGRSTDEKHHEDGSLELTDRLCKRLHIAGYRRQQLMFLVAHHLTMFLTATKKDVEDPAVVAEFGNLVRHSSWLDALYLLTFADSSATHEHGWTDWKEMQIRRLYKQTADFLQDQEAFRTKAQSVAAEIRNSVETALDHSYRSEITAHWESMPDRYFRLHSAEQVVNHLRQMRKYFRQIGKSDATAALTPVLKWISHASQGLSELLVISWDRNHLLSRMAGILSAHNLNILSADFFTRKDGVVLDIFRVCTVDHRSVQDLAVQEAVLGMTQQAFGGAKLDFPELIARHDQGNSIPQEWQDDFPPTVRVSNTENPEFTAVEVEAIDRIGLLYKIFRSISRMEMNIVQARITTEVGKAVDYFLVSEQNGKKVEDPERLGLLADKVGKAVGWEAEMA